MLFPEEQKYNTLSTCEADERRTELNKLLTLYTGDAQQVLSGLSDASVQTCITSPPYFNLRSYLPAACGPARCGAGRG